MALSKCVLFCISFEQKIQELSEDYEACQIAFKKGNEVMDQRT